MGSAFTSDLAAMTSFARVLKGRGFFFVDSVTSAGTVGAMAMQQEGVPATRRDVFLDDDGRPEGMRRQWAAAIALAKERGEAILLCHARRRRTRPCSNCSRSCAGKGSSRDARRTTGAALQDRAGAVGGT